MPKANEQTKSTPKGTPKVVSGAQRAKKPEGGGAVDRYKKLSEDYFKRPDIYGRAARKKGMSRMEFLETRIPIEERDQGGASALEIVMWHRSKVQLIGRGYSQSSPLIDVGDFTSEQFNKTTDAKLFWEFAEDSYCGCLQTGASPEELANISPDRRNPETMDRLETLAGLSENTAENPYDEQPMILSKQWEPQIDYRRVVARVQNTSRQTVRIPYNTTEEGGDDGEINEQDITPEGVAPLVVELGYSRDTLDFNGYGATLIATDDYLLDNQTTAEAIREEVMKLGMRRREALFHELILLVASKVKTARSIDFTSSAGYTDGLTQENWNKFRKVYENYAMNIMIGGPNSISEWETMYFGVGGNQTVTMDFFARKGRGSNPMVLNNQPSIPDYGWINREKTLFNSSSDTISIGEETNVDADQFLITFDRRHTLRVWFRRGLAQDEMERVPGERKMKRHLHTDVGYIVPDEHSIWMVNW